MKITISLLFVLISFHSQAKGMIFSLGAGNWSPKDSSTKVNNNSALSSFEQAKFVRLSHEGLLGGNFLYVVSAGLNVASAKASFEYEGESSTSTVNELESEISMAEARFGFKYNLGQWFYLGAGILAGDFQIDYDRDSYVASGEDTVNYVASENQNYLGYYSEAGIMLIANNWGVRFGAEMNSATMQKNVETLGQTQPILDSTKVYMEILWKN